MKPYKTETTFEKFLDENRSLTTNKECSKMNDMKNIIYYTWLVLSDTGKSEWIQKTFLSRKEARQWVKKNTVKTKKNNSTIKVVKFVREFCQN